jgi:hypothetical protein
VQEWIAVVGAKTAYIERGSPWENGYIESFDAGTARAAARSRDSSVSHLRGYGPFGCVGQIKGAKWTVAEMQHCPPNVTSSVSILYSVSEPRHRVGEGKAMTPHV